MVKPEFTLSVVVPTYGGRVSVKATVEALLADPSGGLEVIVVSDGDPTAVRLALSSVHDHRLRLMAQEHRGAGAARNLGLREATSDWVSFVDDDDVPRSDYRTIWASGACERVQVMTACAQHWRGASVVNEMRCCHLNVDDPTMGASSLLAGAFAIRRAALLAVDGYDEELMASENQDLGLRLLEYLSGLPGTELVRHIDQVVIDIHTEDASHRSGRYGARWAAAARAFQRRYPDRLAARPADAATMHRIIGRAALDEDRLSDARRSAWAGAKIYPGGWANWRFLLITLAPGFAQKVAGLLPSRRRRRAKLPASGVAGE